MYVLFSFPRHFPSHSIHTCTLARRATNDRKWWYLWRCREGMKRFFPFPIFLYFIKRVFSSFSAVKHIMLSVRIYSTKLCLENCLTREANDKRNLLHKVSSSLSNSARKFINWNNFYWHFSVIWLSQLKYSIKIAIKKPTSSNNDKFLAKTRMMNFEFSHYWRSTIALWSSSKIHLKLTFQFSNDLYTIWYIFCRNKQQSLI